MARSVSQLKEEARRAEQREEWSRSIELYLEALRISEESGDISLDLSLYNRIGDLYRRSGDTDEAVRFYRKAVEQYAEQGLHTGAVALCNKILRLAPEEVGIYRVLGRLHASSGLAAEARKAFRQYAERMEERGNTAAARDGYLELARETGDGELLAEVAGRMMAAGREEDARSAVREAWEDQQARAGDPDPHVREAAEELGVLGTEGDVGARRDAAPGADSPAAEPADAESGGTAEEPTSPPSGAREGSDAPPPTSSAPPTDRPSADADREAAESDGAPADEEEGDAEGVELDDILLHEPSEAPEAEEAETAPETEDDGETAAGAASDPGRSARGGDAGDAGDAPRTGTAGGRGATDDPGPAESPSAAPAGSSTEPDVAAGGDGEEARPDATEAPATPEEGRRVDLGDRVRRRLESGDERAAGAAPAPSDFDDMLVGFRAEAAETAGEADPDAHVELGVALRQMGLLDDAIREFQIAARAPDPPLRAFEALGECFLEKDLHSVAVRVLNRALRLPGHQDHELLGVLHQLGVAYQTVGRHDEALDCFERVFSVDIDFRDVAERMRSARSQV